jgi:hypothetical protein
VVCRAVRHEIWNKCPDLPSSRSVRFRALARWARARRYTTAPCATRTRS